MTLAKRHLSTVEPAGAVVRRDERTFWMVELDRARRQRHHRRDGHNSREDEVAVRHGRLPSATVLGPAFCAVYRPKHVCCRRVRARQLTHEHRRALLQHSQARHEGCLPALRQEAPAPLRGGVRFRYNHRVQLGVSDAARTEAALRGIIGQRLPCRSVGGSQALNE